MFSLRKKVSSSPRRANSRILPGIPPSSSQESFGFLMFLIISFTFQLARKTRTRKIASGQKYMNVSPGTGSKR